MDAEERHTMYLLPTQLFRSSRLPANQCMSYHVFAIQATTVFMADSISLLVGFY